MERTLDGIPLRELAEDRWACARRAEDSARDGERVAADPSESSLVRHQAATAAKYARQHAAEYRHEAKLFGAGEIPEAYWPQS